MLAATGRKAVAFSSLASPFELAESTRRIAVVYKDGGEQRLATEMARYMARYLSPEIASEVAGVTFVPASRKARARRGFDHAELLAQEVALVIGQPVIPLLSPPRARDQACAFPSRAYGEHGACRIRPAARARRKASCSSTTCARQAPHCSPRATRYGKRAGATCTASPSHGLDART